MSEFKNYIKPGVQKMRPYIDGEDLTGVSVSPADQKLDTLVGGMIAVSEQNDSSWYVSKVFFDENYSRAPESGKTLHNSTVSGARQNVSDLVVFGNGDTFKLICKASSKAEGWMKSTKAMQIDNVGCVIQVTTQQWDKVAEALTFVPDVKIELINDDKKNGRRIVAI